MWSTNTHAKFNPHAMYYDAQHAPHYGKYLRATRQKIVFPSWKSGFVEATRFTQTDFDVSLESVENCENVPSVVKLFDDA